MTQLDPAPKPRRFYRTVEVAPADEGFAVKLDGRSAKSPAGHALWAPTETLARLFATEWDAQSDEIDFATMPATRLAYTTLDRSADARGPLADEIARYADADLVCYLAEDPQALADLEAEKWGPWLAWAERELGITLAPSVGISPARQSPGALEQARRHAADMDDFGLTGLAYATALYGSAVLGFAVARGALDGVEAFELSRLDEAFQEARWGVDSEAAARTERLRDEARLVQAWFAALR